MTGGVWRILRRVQRLQLVNILVQRDRMASSMGRRDNTFVLK
jgi:hypothetical protein